MNAIISKCGRYRYRLSRSVGMGARIVTFIGVNPSTADASIDDATVRKWRGFTQRWDFDRFDVVNVFAYRATDVRALATADDPVGPQNDRHIAAAVAAASLVVPCWGSLTKLPDRLHGRVAHVRELIHSLGVETKCLGTTKHGDPKHPLMLGYDTPLEPWLARLAGESA